MKQLNLFKTNKIHINLYEFYYHIHNIIESEEIKYFACHIILSNGERLKNLIMPVSYNYSNYENEIFKFNLSILFYFFNYHLFPFYSEWSDC
mgnify:CR=1 FL=1